MNNKKEQHHQHSRFSEMASNPTRTRSRLHKLRKKNLIAEFSAVSESPSHFDDFFPSQRKNLIDEFTAVSDLSPVSSVSKVSDGFVYSESFKDSQDPDPEITALSEMFDLKVSPMSKISTGYGEGSSSASVNQFRGVELGGLKMKSLEAEVAAESLEHALFQIMNSADVDRRSKKIAEAVVNIVLEDFKDLVEEKDMLSRVVAAKSRIVLCSFLLWIIFASVVFFMNTTRAVPFSEPPPT